MINAFQSIWTKYAGNFSHSLELEEGGMKVELEKFLYNLHDVDDMKL